MSIGFSVLGTLILESEPCSHVPAAEVLAAKAALRLLCKSGRWLAVALDDHRRSARGCADP